MPFSYYPQWLLKKNIVYHFLSLATKPPFSSKIHVGEGYYFCRAHYFSGHKFQ